MLNKVILKEVAKIVLSGMVLLSLCSLGAVYLIGKLVPKTYTGVGFYERVEKCLYDAR